MKLLRRAIHKSDMLKKKSLKEKATIDIVRRFHKPLRKLAYVTLLISGIFVLDYLLPIATTQEALVDVSHDKDVLGGEKQKKTGFVYYKTESFKFALREQLNGPELIVKHTPILQEVMQVGEANDNGTFIKKENVYDYTLLIYGLACTSLAIVIGLARNENGILLTIINFILLVCLGVVSFI